ncbi:MAG: hypothetical protein Tsb0020_18340 [Haliangiales bacterium]
MSRGDLVIGGLIVVLGAGFLISRLGSDAKPSAGSESHAATTARAAQEAATPPSQAAEASAPAQTPERDGDGDGDADTAAPEKAEATPTTDEVSPMSDADRAFISQARTFPVRFGVGEATPRNMEADRIAAFAKRFARCQGALEVFGYTDNSGAPRENERISEDRARFAQALLLQHGADNQHMVVKGMGSQAPIAEGNTGTARAQNRRVTVRCVREE